MNQNYELKAIINKSIQDFNSFLTTDQHWQGRENEVINLFALRFLAKNISPKGPIQSLDQIGIEVAVRQVTGSVKKYVRKDLVIWPAPCTNAFSGECTPAAILEWKVNNKNKCKVDIEWLKIFKLKYPTCLTYSVCANIKGPRSCEVVHFL